MPTNKLLKVKYYLRPQSMHVSIDNQATNTHGIHLS